jgi:uracil-DNA glycosylase family 4
MAACKPWLEAEIQLLRPTVIVLLGATAAQQLLGPGFSIIRQQHLRLSRAKDPASAAQWAWACR